MTFRFLLLDLESAVFTFAVAGRAPMGLDFAMDPIAPQRNANEPLPILLASIQNEI
jgi:hypothetical protein